MKAAAKVGLGVLAAVAAAIGALIAREHNMVKWSVFDPPVPVPYLTQTLVFDGGVGLVLGNRDRAEPLEGEIINDVMAASEAFILRVAPGEKQWRQVYSGRGEMVAVSSVGGGTFYALGISWFADGSRIPFLEKSRDAGETWRPLPPPPPGLNGMRFVGEGMGWAWSGDTVFASVDDGASWRTVLKVSSGPYALSTLPPAIDAGGDAWVVDGQALIRVSRDRTTRIDVRGTGIPSWIEPMSDGVVWIVSRLGDDGPVRLQRIGPGGEPETRSEWPHFLPGKLFVGPRTMLLAGCDVGKGDEAPRHFLLVSGDGGRTWIREKPAVVSQMGPVLFEADGTLWAYAGMGRIQRRSER